MYLSKLRLNPSDRRVVRDLADCHQMHRTLLGVWDDLPGAGDARAQFGILYRVEADANANPIVLVQTARRPDWSGLPRGYLALGVADSAQVKSLEAAYSDIQSGTPWRFRLRANPTRKIHTDGRPNGQRVDIRGDAALLDWLERKGREQCGFAIPGREKAVVIRAEPALFGHRRSGESNRMAFGSVLFDGRLVATEPDQFGAALREGIGPGKAYGFGLLSIAKAI
jgi:CRISPR system Cascade subunit CasE